MLNTSVSKITALVTIILLLIFSIYLFTSRKRKLSSILLAIFFLANGFYLIDYLLIPIQEVLKIDLQWFDDIGFSFAFLFGPLIWFFIKSITKSRLKINTSMVWHFVPFILFFIAYSIGKNIFCEYGYIILYIQLFTYYLVSLLAIVKYRSEVKSFFSAFNKNSFTWVIYVLIAFILVTTIDFISAILAFFHLDNPTTRANLNFFSVLLNFIYVVYIFYKSIYIPQAEIIPEEKFDNKKYTNSKLTPETKNEILNKLEQYFAEEKPYLNPTLTIKDVSMVIGFPIKSISQVINELLHKNFYDFTNSYRINEAKIHLSKSLYTKETILEILYKCGFNSKSSFNTAFKKHSSITPTQFKRSLKGSNTPQKGFNT